MISGVVSNIFHFSYRHPPNRCGLHPFPSALFPGFIPEEGLGCGNDYCHAGDWNRLLDYLRNLREILCPKVLHSISSPD